MINLKSKTQNIILIFLASFISVILAILVIPISRFIDELGWLSYVHIYFAVDFLLVMFFLKKYKGIIPTWIIIITFSFGIFLFDLYYFLQHIDLESYLTSSDFSLRILAVLLGLLYYKAFSVIDKIIIIIATIFSALWGSDLIVYLIWHTFIY